MADQDERERALSAVLPELLPDLDQDGFRLTGWGCAQSNGRFAITYAPPARAIPRFLVDAVATVTRTGVDFSCDGPVAIARFTLDAVADAGTGSVVSIESLLARDDCAAAEGRASRPVSGTVSAFRARRRWVVSKAKR